MASPQGRRYPVTHAPPAATTLQVAPEFGWLDNPRSVGLLSLQRMMSRKWGGSLVVAVVLASLCVAGRAEAGKAQEKAEEARDFLDRAAGAFALNHYAEAAENYEKAFALKPDPAVLYNAAQAHRLAGNKQRALDLYQSYLRMYGSDKRAEIERHIESLKQAIPNPGTRILIYCNNNFSGAEKPFPSKLATASLNLSTYIALFNYGYRNVFELGPIVDLKDSELEFEGSEVAGG